MREPLDLLDQPIRILRLDGFYDPRVKSALALVEKASVRHFVGERVLESVFQIGKQTGLIKELRRLEVGKAATEFFVR